MGRAQGPLPAPQPALPKYRRGPQPRWKVAGCFPVATMLKMAVSNNLPIFESFTVLKTEIYPNFQTILSIFCIPYGLIFERRRK